MATKIKTRFFCQECGYETAKWLGQCPGCKAWNSLVEEPVSVTAGGKEKKQVLSGVQSAPAVLNEISMEEERRTETGMGELDRVLGGGIVTGSLTLVGGDPGIGKSTLLLQMCRNLSLKKQHILYVSGEESLRQIKMRAMRIGDFSDTLELFCETNLNRIEEVIQQKSLRSSSLTPSRRCTMKRSARRPAACRRCANRLVFCCGWQKGSVFRFLSSVM